MSKSFQLEHECLPPAIKSQFIKAAEWAAISSRNSESEMRIGCSVFEIIRVQAPSAPEFPCEFEDADDGSDAGADPRVQPRPEMEVFCNLLATACNEWAQDVEPACVRCTQPEVDENKYAWMMHAETSALAKCARDGKSTAGAWMYCTDMPCVACAQAIVQAGIACLFVPKSKTLWQAPLPLSSPSFPIPLPHLAASQSASAAQILADAGVPCVGL